MKLWQMGIVLGIAALLAGCPGGGSSGGGSGDGGGNTVAGTIEYLAPSSPGSVSLTLNGSETLEPSAGAEDFAFDTAVAEDESYAVTATYTVDGKTKGWGCWANSPEGTAGTDDISLAFTCGRNVKLTGYDAYVSDKGVVSYLFQASDPASTASDVTDDQPLTSLGVDDFVLYETQDGSTTQQEVTGAENYKEIVPRTDLQYQLRTVLMLDVSNSLTSDDFTKVQEAAKKLVIDESGETPQSNLQDGQSVAIWVFADGIARIIDFTDDHQALADAIDNIDRSALPSGISGLNSTFLYEAAYTGLNQWEDSFTTAGIQQGYLIVITDGADSSGTKTLDEVKTARGDKLTFTVGIGVEGETDNTGTSAATALEEMGNAGFYSIDNVDELTGALDSATQRIANIVDSFYYLHYATSNRSETYEAKLEVDGNAYPGTGKALAGEYTADGGFGVNPTLVISGDRNIPPDQSREFNARVRWANDDAPAFTWYAPADTSLLGYDSDGDANDGTATLTAAASEGSTTAEVSATTDDPEDPSDVTMDLNVTEVSVELPAVMAKGDSYTATAASDNTSPSFEWRSSNTDFCTLSPNTGSEVTINADPYNDGTCTITVKDTSTGGSGIPYSWDITVGTPGATRITLTEGGDSSAGTSGTDLSFEGGTIGSDFTNPDTGYGTSYGWEIDSATAADGSYSIRNQDISSSESAAISLPVPDGATQVYFSVRTSTESSSDYLYFENPDFGGMSWSGETAWMEVGPYEVMPGSEIAWVYSKDSSYYSGSDTVWVDNIRFE